MKQKLTYFSFLTLTFFLFGYSSVAQDERCNTMDALADRLENDAKYAQYYEWARSIPQEERVGQIPCDGTNTITVPVAFHFAPGVVTCGDSDCLLAEVLDQLDAMNIAFGNNTGTANEAACPAAYQDANGNSVASTGTCIDFCLAIPPAGNAQGLDPACDPPITIGEFTGGFNAGGGGAPGWNGILNLFIVGPANCLGVADGIPGAGNGDGVSTCAQAFGGFDPSSGCGLDTDGTYNLGATMIHEIGHYLGLFHTHVDGPPSCTDNDVAAPGPFNVNDTPIMANQFYGCPTGCVTNTSQGTGGACGATNIPTANFMAYTDDACMSMFTEDQAAVMNYWANQLFGGSNSQCSDANPTELTSACENSSCVLVCPAVVTTPIALTDDFCETGAGTFPADPTTEGLVLDDDSDTVYSWSTGNYLSAGGTAVTAPATLTSAGCSIETETYYLNIDCGTTPLATTLDGGTYVVTVYPAPPADISTLVTITGEGGCTEPVVTPIPGCETYITVAGDAGNPAFPVTAGDSGTAIYTVTFTSDPNGPDCCVAGNPDDEGEIIVNGDFTAGTASWTETEESPPGTTTTFGVIGVSGGFVNGAGDNDAWFGGWGANGSYITISQDITIPACNAVNLTFNYGSINCGGPTNTVVDVIIGGVTVGTIDCNNDTPPATFGPVDIIALGITPGATTIVFEGTEMPDAATGSVLIDDVSLVASDCTSPIDCFVDVTADYNCTTMGVGYCDNICFAEYLANPGPDDFVDVLLCVTALGCADNPDASCLEDRACDDGDCNTENDMGSYVIATDEECSCAGTPITPPDCDDMDCNTADSYDTATCTCVNDAIPPPDCDDMDCNTADSYDTATCTCVNDAIPPPDCDDMDCNTADSYDTATCTCVNDAIPPPDCDDMDCNTTDSYDTATCSCVNDAIPPPDCDDADCNTADSYDTATCTCVNDPITPPDCDDADCNTADSYDAATCSCVNDAIPPPDCDDADCNTADVYNTATCMCENNPIEPGACDDSDCTTDDSYDDVNCVCINDPITPPDCDDSDCTTDDSYDTATCTCVNDPITPPDCDDADCTTDDSYDTATCTCVNDAITPPDCDDADCTTDDSYDNATCTCINDPITPPDCDDADCNTADVYNTDTCVCENNPITPDACDDMDCTTDDSYDAVACTCVNTPIPPPDPNDNCDVTDDSYDTATCTIINTPNCPAGSTYNAATCNCDIDTCEDPIAGNVNVTETTCLLPGVEVIILDSTGMPVAGSPVTIDVNGDYFLAGPFPCGNYTAELDLTTLPPCYTELEGETGPLGFTVNGDGVADGTEFSNQAMVPTLSQWGLMILALLLMTFGAIRLSAFRRVKALN